MWYLTTGNDMFQFSNITNKITIILKNNIIDGNNKNKNNILLFLNSSNCLAYIYNNILVSTLQGAGVYIAGNASSQLDTNSIIENNTLYNNNIGIRLINNNVILKSNLCLDNTTDFAEIGAATGYNNASSDAAHLIVFIDACYCGNLGHLLDNDSDGIYDFFYCNDTGLQTIVDRNEDGFYLIDTDGDGVWDYSFDTISGAISIITSVTEFPWLFVAGLVIAVAVIAIIIYLYKKEYF